MVYIIWKCSQYKRCELHVIITTVDSALFHGEKPVDFMGHPYSRIYSPKNLLHRYELM